MSDARSTGENGEPPKPGGTTERDRKLVDATVAYFNGLAIVLVAVGGLGPIINMIYSADGSSISPTSTTAISLLCVLASGAIHLVVRSIIRREWS